MATVRNGAKEVLVIVDAQVGVLATTWEPEKIVKNIALVVEKARAAGIPIVWVQHADEEIEYGSPGWEWAPPLEPTEEETRIYKSYNSAFEETPLEAELARLGATGLVIAGAATNWCIRATTFAALDRGYDVTLIQDGHTTESMELGENDVIQAADIIREFNLGIQWVSYPGRETSTPTAEALTFSEPASDRSSD